MYHLTSKILCSTAIITLLNTFFDPLYAGKDKDPSLQEELKGVRRNLQSLEESSKAETKASHLSNRHSKRAIGDPIGNEFSINQNATGVHVYPSVAGLTNGNVFVTWWGYQTGNSHIYGRVFSPLGTPISNEFDIPQNTTGDQQRSSVAGLTNGNVFIAWISFQNGTAVYGRVFSPLGAALTNDFDINQNTTDAQDRPSVASLTNGNVFVAWESSQTGDYDVYGRVFSPLGTPISNEFLINQNTTGDQALSSVAGLTNGDVFVAWYRTFDSNVYGRVFSPLGTPISNEFVINQNTTGVQANPFVAGLNNGNVFVAWGGTQTGNDDIYGRIFSPLGIPISNEFDINQNTTRNQQSPSVASLTNGNVFVAWQGYQTGNYDVYGRVFSPLGAALTNDFGIYGTTGSGLPSVAGLTNGNVFVVWEHDYNYISGRIISGTITFAPTESPTVAPTNPTKVPTSSGNRLMPTWMIPAKVVMGGVENLWTLATTKTWKNLEKSEDAFWTQPAVLKEKGEKCSRPIQTTQKVINYVHSWFSSKSWNEYFDSMEKSILDYSKSVVEETPSYQNAYFGKSTLKGNTPLMSNVSYNSSLGAGFLPYSVVSGAIGQ